MSVSGKQDTAEKMPLNWKQWERERHWGHDMSVGAFHFANSCFPPHPHSSVTQIGISLCRRSDPLNASQRRWGERIEAPRGYRSEEEKPLWSVLVHRLISWSERRQPGSPGNSFNINKTAGYRLPLKTERAAAAQVVTLFIFILKKIKFQSCNRSVHAIFFF